jgi:hypothetical protein
VCCLFLRICTFRFLFGVLMETASRSSRRSSEFSVFVVFFLLCSPYLGFNKLFVL